MVGRAGMSDKDEEWVEVSIEEADDETEKFGISGGKMESLEGGLK